MAHEPLCVAAHLFDGRIAATELMLPLDSILAYAWMAEHHPDRLHVVSSGFDPADLIVPELPLERRGEGDLWYWACSCAFGQPLMEQTAHWHKRFDAFEAEQYMILKRRNVVNTAAGPYKAHRIPLTVFLVPRLEWWLVGDLGEVRRLLQGITHVGKKRGQGYGRIARWEVALAAEDRSHARPIPDPEGDAHLAIRPPYWHPMSAARVRWPEDPRLACNSLRRESHAV